MIFYNSLCVYNLIKKIYMKIPIKLEPLITGFAASIIIGVLSYLSFNIHRILVNVLFRFYNFNSFNLLWKWICATFKYFFGHLLGIIVGILFNEFFGISFITLGLAVGSTVTLMIYFKIIHPPAAANPLIALFADVSLNYIIFPVLVGSIVIIFLTILINRFILKRSYPKKWF